MHEKTKRYVDMDVSRAEYQFSTRKARRVFHRLGRPSPSSISTGIAPGYVGKAKRVHAAPPLRSRSIASPVERRRWRRRLTPGLSIGVRMPRSRHPNSQGSRFVITTKSAKSTKRLRGSEDIALHSIFQSGGVEVEQQSRSDARQLHVGILSLRALRALRGDSFSFLER